MITSLFRCLPWQHSACVYARARVCTIISYYVSCSSHHQRRRRRLGCVAPVFVCSGAVLFTFFVLLLLLTFPLKVKLASNEIR